MNLESSAQSLLEQYPEGVHAELDRRERQLEKFGQFAFYGFGIVFGIAVLGLIYVIFDRMVFSGDNPVVGVFMSIVIIFSLLMLAYVMFREDLKEKRKKAMSVPARNDLPPPAVTGRLIEDRPFEPVPTVIEDTTDLLPARKRDQQDR